MPPGRVHETKVKMPDAKVASMNNHVLVSFYQTTRKYPESTGVTHKSLRIDALY